MHNTFFPVISRTRNMLSLRAIKAPVREQEGFTPEQFCDQPELHIADNEVLVVSDSLNAEIVLEHIAGQMWVDSDLQNMSQRVDELVSVLADT